MQKKKRDTTTIAETERCILRAWSPEDLDDATEMYLRPEHADFFLHEPIDRGHIRRGIASSILLHEKFGYSFWPLFLKETGALIGHCGLQPLREVGEIEVGYLVVPEHRGKGIATEAARAAVGYGFKKLGLPRIVAIALPENTASIRVMEKLGMEYEKNISRKGLEFVLYALERTQNRRS